MVFLNGGTRMQGRQIVITSTNSISELGYGNSEMWSNILRGKQGFSKKYKTTAPRQTSFSGEVDRAKIQSDYFSSKEFDYLDDMAKFAVSATLDLAQEERFFESEMFGYDPFRIGVNIGVGLFGLGKMSEASKFFLNKDYSKVSYHHLASMIPNSAPAQISIKLGTKGISTSASSACSSSLIAIKQSYLEIAGGFHDMMITGGVDAPLEDVWHLGFSKLALADSSSENGCKPFSSDRNGTVSAEGAGIIFLEERENALKRGANIQAEIVGFSSTSDSFHNLAMEPSAEAPIRAMESALKMANLNPSDIDWIGSHSPGTKKGDIYESKAISKVFGEKTPPVTALKSYFGHTIGASGVNEMIAMIESAKRGMIIPTLNLTNIDGNSQINHCLEVKECNVRYILKNSFGFGGTNSSVILKINK